MPTYYNTNGSWTQFVSTGTTGSDEIYVRTSGTGAPDLRISNVYVRTDSGWVEVFTAYNSPPIGTPSLSFITTAANNRTEAYLQWTASSGATGYEFYVNNSLYTTTSNLSITVPVSPNNSDSSFTAYNFKVRAYNQYGYTSFSSIRTMVPGGIDVPWSATYSANTQTLLADVLSTTNQTRGYISSIQFPSASSSFESGYYRIDYFSVEIYPSNTSGMPAPTSSSRKMGLKIGTNAIDFTNVVWEETSTNGIYAWTKREALLNLNSNNFGNQRLYWMVDGGGWTTSDSMNTTFGYYARNLYLQGVRSTASTYS